MGMRSGSVRLALCAMLIGTGSAWALAPHDKAVGVNTKQVEQSRGTSANDTTEAQPDKRGTADRPFIVKSISPEKTPDEAAKDARDRKNKRWNDGAGLLIGALTILVLLAQSVVFLFQAVLFRRQAKSLKDTIRTMRRVGNRQSIDMRNSTAAARSAATAAAESTNLARLALEAAETPFLMIVVTPGNLPLDPNWPAIPTNVIAFYHFENCGRSPANVLEIRLDPSFGAATPEPAFFPPLSTVHGGSYILPQGKGSEPSNLTVGEFQGWNYNDLENPAWINGHIRYSDVFENQFLTRFSFYRNSKNGRWLPQGGAGHNGRFRLTGDDLIIARARDRGEYLIRQTADAKP